MSKECLTVAQARVKLGFGGTIPATSDEIVNKEQCLAMRARPSSLTKYTTNWECPADDDIVPAVITMFERTHFALNYGEYTYQTEQRCGYYKDACGSISNFTSTNNWALDTFFIDKNQNNTAAKLVIHRGFNAQDYIADTLTLRIEFEYRMTISPQKQIYDFTYAYGSTGFQYWTCVQGTQSFQQFLSQRGPRMRSIDIEYYGALK